MNPTMLTLELTEQERQIIPMAIEAGRDYYVGEFGKQARLKANEAAAFIKLLVDGGKVPVVALAFACYGLERLWWVENKRIPGIPELLARLERLCGYRRTGGEPPRKGR